MLRNKDTPRVENAGRIVPAIFPGRGPTDYLRFSRTFSEQLCPLLTSVTTTCST